MGGSFQPAVGQLFFRRIRQQSRGTSSTCGGTRKRPASFCTRPGKRLPTHPRTFRLKTKYTAAIADRVAEVKTPFTEYLRRYAEVEFPDVGRTGRGVVAGPREHHHRAQGDFSWTWTSTTARPTATRSVGRPARNRVWASRRLRVNTDLNMDRFVNLFVDLMQRPARATP